MKARTKWLVLAGIVLAALAGLIVSKKFSYVDPKPGLAIGEEYFTRLEEGQVSDAFDLYTEGFLQKEGKTWERTLAGLDAEAGKVTRSSLQSSTIAPIPLQEGSVVPCVLIRYEVARSEIVTKEKLTVCARQRGEEWAIAGHDITRSDTGQHFEAGLTIMEKEIFSTKQSRSE